MHSARERESERAFVYRDGRETMLEGISEIEVPPSLFHPFPQPSLSPLRFDIKAVEGFANTIFAKGQLSTTNVRALFCNRLRTCVFIQQDVW